MTKHLRLAAIVLLGLSSTACSYLWDRDFVVEITEEQIQEKIDAQFPISERYLAFLELVLTDPVVTLEEGSDRIGFEVSALTNIRVDEKDLAGRAGITTGIRYDSQRGSLLAVDPQVEYVALSPMPEKYRDGVMLAADAAARKFLDGYRIFELDQSDFKQRLAKLILKDVVVQNGVLRVTLGAGE